VEVASSADVQSAHARVNAQGLVSSDPENVTCCVAQQDNVWIAGPDDRPWEIYAVISDASTTPPCSCC
jgi:hypothetical protein